MCVNLTDQQKEILELLKEFGISRSHVVREALNVYLSREMKRMSARERKLQKLLKNLNYKEIVK